MLISCSANICRLSAAIVSRDRFLPRQFTTQGDRLAFQTAF